MTLRTQSLDCNFLRLLRLHLPLILLSVFCLFTPSAYAQAPRDSLLYIVQMESGDRFRGNLVGYTDSTVTIETEFGPVTVRKTLIERFIPVDGPQLKSPFHFFMPTAAPLGRGGFISNYELGFWQAGVGLGNGATITGAMSTLPGVPLSNQIYHAGVKFTVERSPESELAIGAAYTFLTTDYPYAHIFGVMTVPLGTGRYSAMIFYKVSGNIEAPIAVQAFDFDTTRFTVFYTGSVGVAFGFDTPAFGREDIRWVGEIWNNDVTQPQNTVSMLGVRLLNDRLSADFGIALFTAPFIVPVTKFSWLW